MLLLRLVLLPRIVLAPRRNMLPPLEDKLLPRKDMPRLKWLTKDELLT